MDRKSLTGLGLALLLGSGVAQDGIAWEGDWDGGLKRAKAESKPIMVAFILKGESANDEIVRLHFKDPKIIELSRHFVCFVACLGEHDGGAGGPCPAFGAVDCGAHQRIEMRARTQVLESHLVSAPQFVFLAPDGKTVLVRRVWMLPPGELLDKMTLARAYVDPSTAPPGFQQHRDHVAALLEEAASDHQDKRRQALGTLAKIDDPRVLEFLIHQTGPQADTQKRIEAILFMRERGNAKALPCLHRLVTTGDSQHRMFAAIALEGIGMRESTESLLLALKKEGKDRVRSHIARAIFSCVDEDATRRGVVLDLLKSNSQLDQVVALFLAPGLEKHPDLEKALLRAMASANTQVRCSAYYAIGTLRIEKAREPIERRIPSEKEPALSFAKWALAQIGGTLYDGEVDPAAETLDLLPDNGYYEGDLSGGKSNRQRPGGGRGGGGRGGGR